MSDALIEHIRAAFAGNAYPGDAFLVGSREGCEPYDVVSSFFGRWEWWTIEPDLLDGCYEALSFFSECGFRFFLPAYMIADVRDQLKTADPVFHLTHGFHRISVDLEGESRRFTRSSGGDVLVNPRRYGAITWQDRERFRLSVFCREEAAAIVAYLEHRRLADDFQAPAIDAALAAFWRARAAQAATAAELAAHIAEDAAYAADLERKFSRGAGTPQTEQ